MYTPPRKKGPRAVPLKYTGKIRLKVGEVVRVISGKDKGKEGKILRILPGTGKIVVEQVNIVVKHQKPRQTQSGQQTQGAGKVHLEAALHVSKVQLVDPGNPDTTTRVGVKTDADGNRVRFAKKSGGVIDNV